MFTASHFAKQQLATEHQDCVAMHVHTCLFWAECWEYCRARTETHSLSLWGCSEPVGPQGGATMPTVYISNYRGLGLLLTAEDLLLQLHVMSVSAMLLVRSSTCPPTHFCC